MNRAGRIGLVPARFGPEVVGGAEVALREMGEGLAARGWEVEILTTCAKDHYRWDNVFPPGLTQEGALRVRRFPAVVSTPGRERAEIEAAILRGDPVPLQLQQRWMNDGMRVPGLFHHLLDHARAYRALVFAPYPFWPAFACSQVAPERSLLMPCLHDEPYAYLELFRPVFQGVAGLLFLSEPEQELARRIAAPLAAHELIGSGVRVPHSYDPEGFRARHGLTRPFLLYAGRREGAKNWERLLDMFARAVLRMDLPFDLVTMGVGEVRPPREIAARVVDLGFLSEAERNDAFAAAAAYVQPSHLESFSRTAMEAWLAGTPVIANAAGEVVAHHIARSGAGLVYSDAVEFEECLAFLADAPAAATALAASGRDYVLQHYTWDAVLDRLEPALERLTPADAAGAASDREVPCAS